jgi:hypothetical protein
MVEIKFSGQPEKEEEKRAGQHFFQDQQTVMGHAGANS